MFHKPEQGGGVVHEYIGIEHEQAVVLAGCVYIHIFVFVRFEKLGKSLFVQNLGAF